MTFLTPRQGFVQCLSPAGLHRMAWREWGDPSNPRVLLCVHGLTRVGNDFDRLAGALADRYRVVCPDVVGRGASDWLRDPRHYGIGQYAADMVTLLARLDAASVDWVGTSMGGLIGMTLAGQEEAAPRLKLRYRGEDKKPRLAHTLNGSALALARIVAALLENNQTPEGIRIPKALQPYTGFAMITK